MKSEIPPVDIALPARESARRFSSTRLGASLARRTAVSWLAGWGWAPGGEVSCAAALVVAELAANAVLHGRLPGRYFELRMAAEPPVIRIEVTDARGELRPRLPGSPARPDAEGGRGLLLVDHLASRWGVRDRSPLGKTVWAELEAVA